MTQHFKNLIVIVFISNLLFFHTYQNPFHLDDLSTIVDRPLIKDLNNFWNAADGIFQNRVFLLYSFALNHHIGSLNVFGYHLVNILLHSLISVLIYFLANEILVCRLGDLAPINKNNKQNNKISFLSSLLFSIHPLQTESVTYISSRSTLAVTLFFLLSFLVFIKGLSVFFRQERKFKDIVFFIIFLTGGILLFLAGTGFKETILTLPPILLIYIALFYSTEALKLRKTLITISAIVFFLLAHIGGFVAQHEKIEQLSVSSGITENQDKNAQKIFTKSSKLRRNNNPIIYTLYFYNNKPNFLTNLYELIYSRAAMVYLIGNDSYLPKDYFLTELEVVGLYYLKELFLPFNQSVFPDFPKFSANHWKTLVGAIIIIVSISIYCFASNRRIIYFSFLWYIIALSPYVSFIPLTDLVSEHRTYLPNIGFFMVVSVLLVSSFSAKRNLIFLVFVQIIIISAALLNLNRNSVWHSELSLWEDAVKKAPLHVKSINALGVEYANKGNNQKAQSIFHQGLDIDPFNYSMNINLGRIYRDQGYFDKSEKLFKLAALVSKDYLAYINLGQLYLNKKDYNKSLKQFKEALRLNPHSDSAHFFIGRVYSELSKHQQAIIQYKKSIELNPDFADPYNNMGNVYWNLKEYDMAYNWFVKTINKFPEIPEPYFNIGNYFLINGDKKQAVKFFNLYKEKLKNEKK